MECPSLSPDGKRLAFKKRVGGLLRPVWRFHVLDLATMSETPLAELRSIDDQIEWLDDRQVLYGDGSTIWVAAADGTGQPRKFLSQATSPTVLRRALPGAAADGTGPVAGNGLTLQCRGPRGRDHRFSERGPGWGRGELRRDGHQSRSR